MASPRPMLISPAVWLPPAGPLLRRMEIILNHWTRRWNARVSVPDRFLSNAGQQSASGRLLREHRGHMDWRWGMRNWTRWGRNTRRAGAKNYGRRSHVAASIGTKINPVSMRGRCRWWISRTWMRPQSQRANCRECIWKNWRRPYRAWLGAVRIWRAVRMPEPNRTGILRRMIFLGTLSITVCANTRWAPS